MSLVGRALNRIFLIIGMLEQRLQIADRDSRKPVILCVLKSPARQNAADDVVITRQTGPKPQTAVIIVSGGHALTIQLFFANLRVLRVERTGKITLTRRDAAPSPEGRG